MVKHSQFESVWIFWGVTRVCPRILCKYCQTQRHSQNRTRKHSEVFWKLQGDPWRLLIVILLPSPPSFQNLNSLKFGLKSCHVFLTFSKYELLMKLVQQSFFFFFSSLIFLFPFVAQLERDFHYW